MKTIEEIRNETLEAIDEFLSYNPQYREQALNYVENEAIDEKRYKDTTEDEIASKWSICNAKNREYLQEESKVINYDDFVIANDHNNS